MRVWGGSKDGWGFHVLHYIIPVVIHKQCTMKRLRRDTWVKFTGIIFLYKLYNN
jgi:hypothetical protein